MHPWEGFTEHVLPRSCEEQHPWRNRAQTVDSKLNQTDVLSKCKHNHSSPSISYCRIVSLNSFRNAFMRPTNHDTRTPLSTTSHKTHLHHVHPPLHQTPIPRHPSVFPTPRSRVPNTCYHPGSWVEIAFRDAHDATSCAAPYRVASTTPKTDPLQPYMQPFWAFDVVLEGRRVSRALQDRYADVFGSVWW